MSVKDRLCDFHTLAGERVCLDHFPHAPLLNLRAGSGDNRFILDRSQAVQLRDALNAFLLLHPDKESGPAS